MRLVGVIKPEGLKGEYERTNRDMVAEIARRNPVSTDADVAPRSASFK